MKESSIISNISAKLGINTLNAMQKTMAEKANQQQVILLSPTGSGKTIAFALPLLKNMKDSTGRLQAIIISPARELTIQTAKVIQSISGDYKVSCCYGGHNFEDEKNSLSVTPDILIGTPGRLLDHIKRKNIDILPTRILVLDEFDKALELGFQDEMKQILGRLPNLSKKILTSATSLSDIPDFVKFNDNFEELNFLSQNNLGERMRILQVESNEKDKLTALNQLLNNLDGQKTIVFANYREAVERIFSFLKKEKKPVGLYHGGLDQIDREKAISLLNNGTFKILVSTDLGSRGLDIKDVSHIIHYHLPKTEDAYIHRNGRTARINSKGSIYIITSPEEKLPSFIEFDDKFPLSVNATSKFEYDTETLFFSEGKKEKISKGDILGFLIAKGNLEASDIGRIEVADHYAMVAIPSKYASSILNRISGHKIKNRKVKISLVRQQNLVF